MPKTLDEVPMEQQGMGKMHQLVSNQENRNHSNILKRESLIQEIDSQGIGRLRDEKGDSENTEILELQRKCTTFKAGEQKGCFMRWCYETYEFKGRNPVAGAQA